MVYNITLLPMPLFSVFCFSVFRLFLSFLVWIFLWFLEEVSTLLWVFLHRENGDFSILMKDIPCY